MFLRRRGKARQFVGVFAVFLMAAAMIGWDIGLIVAAIALIFAVFTRSLEKEPVDEDYAWPDPDFDDPKAKR
jgi:hypothetical protein